MTPKQNIGILDRIGSYATCPTQRTKRHSYESNERRSSPCSWAPKRGQSLRSSSTDVKQPEHSRARRATNYRLSSALASMHRRGTGKRNESPVTPVGGKPADGIFWN
jgi:hypothetical protein